MICADIYSVIEYLHQNKIVDLTKILSPTNLYVFIFFFNETCFQCPADNSDFDQENDKLIFSDVEKNPVFLLCGSPLFYSWMRKEDCSSVSQEHSVRAARMCA
jgi:hypothetical protein